MRRSRHNTLVSVVPGLGAKKVQAGIRAATSLYLRLFRNGQRGRWHNTVKTSNVTLTVQTRIVAITVRLSESPSGNQLRAQLEQAGDRSACIQALQFSRQTGDVQKAREVATLILMGVTLLILLTLILLLPLILLLLALVLLLLTLILLLPLILLLLTLILLLLALVLLLHVHIVRHLILGLFAVLLHFAARLLG